MGDICGATICPVHPHLATLDLNLLLVFDAVYRNRSTTRAGEELKVTQSAVSNALQRLGRTVGARLFVRTARGMVPTEAATRLAVPVQEALARIDDAMRRVQRLDMRQAERTFRIYVSDAGQLVGLPTLLPDLWAKAPALKIETVSTSPQEARKLMQDGEVDLAFGHFDGFDEGFFHEALFQERYVCLVRIDHPTIGARITLQQFFDTPHAVYRPTAGSHAFFEATIEKLFAEHGRRRRVALRLSHGLGIAEILRQTDLLAFLPSRLAREVAGERRLRVVQAPFPSPRFDICLYWHARQQNDEAHAWLRQLFRARLGGSNPSLPLKVARKFVA
jgi:DNA-binding transcriptional LysR family regulator